MESRTKRSFLNDLALPIALSAIVLFSSLALLPTNAAKASGSLPYMEEFLIAGQAPNTTGGIVPCGRNADNPETANDETKECSLCHLAYLANNLILFLFSIASVAALLALVIAGFLYISAGANPVAKNQAHTAIINIIKGYIVIFCAWLIVDFVMSAWGFINPIQGEWYVVCLLSTL